MRELKRQIKEVNNKLDVTNGLLKDVVLHVKELKELVNRFLNE